MTFSLWRVTRKLKPIQRQEAGYILSRSPTITKLAPRWTTIYTHIHTFAQFRVTSRSNLHVGGSKSTWRKPMQVTAKTCKHHIGTTPVEEQVRSLLRDTATWPIVNFPWILFLLFSNIIIIRNYSLLGTFPTSSSTQDWSIFTSGLRLLEPTVCI